MDQKIRAMLRDPDATPQQCYWALKRAGYSRRDIYELLVVESGRVSSAPGHWPQLLVDMGELDLEQARINVAWEMFEMFVDPGYTVVEYSNNNNWDETGEDSLSFSFFVEGVDEEDDGDDEDGDLDYVPLMASWGLNFYPNSAIPEVWDDSYIF
jgi:hypothetical protein